jgi:hypothetical protein
MGEKKNAWLLVGKRPLGRWMDNIKLGHGEIGWSGVGWIGLAQDRDKWKALENVVMRIRVK